MRNRESTPPLTFLFLVLPYGISSGFVSITLPFLLTKGGFSVALAASSSKLSARASSLIKELSTAFLHRA